MEITDKKENTEIRKKRGNKREAIGKSEGPKE